MLDSTTVIITQHARRRFIERGGVGDVAKQVRSARLATRSERLRISQSCPKNAPLVASGSGYLYYVSHSGFVFVVDVYRPGMFRVVTCWPMDQRKQRSNHR